jgi:hypothetical protein
VREIPPSGASERDRDFAINQLVRGYGNNTGSVTLRASQTTTTVTRSTINSASVPLLVPTTETARTAEWRISAVAAGSFTITHDSTADTDRIFLYAVVGG